MKVFLLSCIAALSLMAGEKISAGEKIFQNKCASCHIKITTKDEALKNIKELKAPPMVEVSSRLKEMIKITDDIDDMIHKGVVIAFIKDYVIYPDIEKSMCHAMAVDRFGTMPSLKGKITEEELQSVAEWIYDYFEGKKF
jgi:mono/diheme cytochrome c family protein